VLRLRNGRLALVGFGLAGLLNGCLLLFNLDGLTDGGSTEKTGADGSTVVDSAREVAEPFRDASESAVDESEALQDEASAPIDSETVPDACMGVACDAACGAMPNCGLDGETSGLTIGGTLTGLSPGDAIQMTLNGSDEMTLSSNGPFTFRAALPPNASYNAAAALTSGSSIPEICAVQNATGTATANVTDINVVCVPNDLLYYFPFSGNPNDESGHGNNATITGSVTLTADRYGHVNSAYHFDGSSAYLSATGGLLPVGGASRTLTVWIETLMSTADWGIVYWGSGNCPAHMFGLGVTSGDRASIWEGCNDSASALVVPANAWTFVAIAFSSDVPTSYSLYVNDQSAVVQLSAPPNTSAGPLTMGYDSAGLVVGGYFYGNLGTVRVYGRALSASEIQGIFVGAEP
jgi:hypothetical protein